MKNPKMMRKNPKRPKMMRAGDPRKLITLERMKERNRLKTQKRKMVRFAHPFLQSTE